MIVGRLTECDLQDSVVVTTDGYAVFAGYSEYIFRQSHAKRTVDAEVPVLRCYALPCLGVLERTLCCALGVVVIYSNYIACVRVCKVSRLEYNVVFPRLADRLGSDKDSALDSRKSAYRCADRAQNTDSYNSYS